MKITFIKYNNLIIFSGILSLITGCAAGPSAKTYTGPTGETSSNIRCTVDTSSCFEKASEVCNGGTYQVTSSYRNAGGLFADYFPGPVTWYTMSIICGSTSGQMPTFPLRGSEPAMPAYQTPVNQPPVYATPPQQPNTVKIRICNPNIIGDCQ